MRIIPPSGPKKTNPNKPNFQKAKMNVSLTLTKDYRKNDDFTVRKNKPNSNPISVTPKMNVNLYVIDDYENETAFRLQKNKPNQTQFQRQKKSRYLVVSFLRQECKIETIVERVLYILQI